MGWETFKRQRAPLATQPYVTIQKRGSISLNAAAHAALGSPRTVALLYDRDEQLVGLQATPETTEHAYAVRGEPEKSSYFLISGRAFAKYYDIPVDVARRYPAELVDDVLVVDLKKEGTVVVSNRERGRQRAAAPG